MSRRRWLATGVGCGLVSGLVWSCAADSRHRVLSFFFDGVPPPGAAGVGPTDAAALATSGAEGQTTQVAVARPTYAHEPYRTNRCNECHDTLSGGLVRELGDGLCRICHGELVDELRYVHGPVAADACVQCHHYHSAFHKQLLLDEPRTLCLKCHDLADLGPGPHHDDLEADCTDCHDPHGGADTSFLRRGAP